MQNFAVFFVVDLRKAKWSTMIGLEQPSLPVTVAMGGTSSAAKVMPTACLSVTPSSWRMKSRCQ
jgi:hypothetical protein